MDRAEGIRGDMQETLDAMYDARESRGIEKQGPLSAPPMLGVLATKP